MSDLSPSIHLSNEQKFSSEEYKRDPKNPFLELAIEDKLVRQLVEQQGYVYCSDISTDEQIKANFRKKFEDLNNVHLSDHEFRALLDQIINADVFVAAKNLRSKHTLIREDGTPLIYSLVNLKSWCENHFELIRQPRFLHPDSEGSLKKSQRHDVILLLNGLPVVQIELKRPGLSPRRALEQIANYKKAQGNPYTNTLLCFIQIFVAASESEVFYFANNNLKFLQFGAKEQYLPIYQWADEKNKKITSLKDFANSFLEKCPLAQMIARYMVLMETEKKILMMRPYQIYAVREIVKIIQENNGNGYIWHTTGSGKTLTSFKASTLLKEMDDSKVKKVLFVVDRKDLDSQTRDEFNKFQAGCVEENSNTRVLIERLLSDSYADKVIVTTIQKLGGALTAKGEGKRQNYQEELQILKNEKMVFIFDECHRSQFGIYHKAIKDFFPNSQLFGFTGTPIFEANATNKRLEQGDAEDTSDYVYLKTTDDIFHKCLHSYLIADAIDDKNVLPFHIHYYGAQDENEEEVSPSPEVIAKAILGELHDRATASRRFNAVFATSSIDDAIAYFDLFERLQQEKLAEDPDYKPLKIAAVFSTPPGVSKDSDQIQEDLETEKEEYKLAKTDEEKAKIQGKTEGLKRIIAHYNKLFGTAERIEEFGSYYADVQRRIKQHGSEDPTLKDQKLDLVIVVDMLLTGFDSKYLNTLYVDKNLKYHGLIQAFSRTNRTLNDSKPRGNILDFRNQKKNVQEAVELFSAADGEMADKQVWFVLKADKKIERLKEQMDTLREFMQDQGLELTPSEVSNLHGNEARAEFVRQYGEIKQTQKDLEQYTDLTPEQKKTIEDILPKEDILGFDQKYQEIGLKLVEEREGEAEEFDEEEDSPEEEGEEDQDSIENLELKLVLFSSELVDYDWIMARVAECMSSDTVPQWANKRIRQLIRADSKFSGVEKDLLETWMDTIQPGRYTKEDMYSSWENFRSEAQKGAFEVVARKFDVAPEKLEIVVNWIKRNQRLNSEMLEDLIDDPELSFMERSQKREAFGKAVATELRKLEAEIGKIRDIHTYDAE
ncbi:type I restriction endonuclease subunit R [Acetobacteraceae bacterium]|nr:type I restriction endonuclease subunit R [Acetobacteraceae bacterium]